MGSYLSMGGPNVNNDDLQRLDHVELMNRAHAARSRHVGDCLARVARAIEDGVVGLARWIAGKAQKERGKPRTCSAT